MTKFMVNNRCRNPYNIGARVFREWYVTHLDGEPIPEDMVPTQEMYDAWDQELERYVLAGLRERFGYEGLREAYLHYAWGGVLCEGDGQCSFDCEYYGVNCPFS